MTWFPVQAALKMSTIPGAIRATLDTLLDHINPDPQDPTRPNTLTVWESRERLAAGTGFSEVTIRDHLKRLRGEADLRPGQRVMVLRWAGAGAVAPGGALRAGARGPGRRGRPRAAQSLRAGGSRPAAPPLPALGRT